MSNGRLVKFRSTVNQRVIVNEPAYNVRREFPNKGAIQTIPFEVVEQLLWSNGFKNMLLSGALYIDDMQDKIDLGLEEPDTEVPTNIKILTEEQMFNLIKNSSYEEFVNELATLSLDQANALVNFAVATQTLEPDKIKYLKEVTGRDVIKILARKSDEAEADRVLAEKEALRRR